MAQRRDRRGLGLQHHKQPGDVGVAGHVHHRPVPAGGEHRVELGHLLAGQLRQRHGPLEAGDGLQPPVPLVGERLAVGPLRVHCGLDLVAGQPERAVLAEYVGKLPVLAPGRLRGCADDPVRLGRAASLRLEQQGDPAGGGQAELGILVQGQADVVDIAGKGAHDRGEVILVLLRVVEEPGQPVGVGVGRLPVGRDHRDVQPGSDEPFVRLDRLLGEVARRMSGPVGERHLAGAGDQISDVNYVASAVQLCGVFPQSVGWAAKLQHRHNFDPWSLTRLHFSELSHWP